MMNRHLIFVGALATALAAVSPVVAQDQPLGSLSRQVAAQEQTINQTALGHDLAKMSASLWHAIAAVGFHLADNRPNDRKVALADYKSDLAAFKEHATDASGRVSRRIVIAYKHIEDGWAQFEEMANALLAAGADDPDHGRNMRALWDHAIQLDSEIASIRKAAEVM